MPTTKLYLSLYIINEGGERVLISPELSEIPLGVLIANIRKTKKFRKHITIYEDDRGEYVRKIGTKKQFRHVYLPKEADLVNAPEIAETSTTNSENITQEVNVTVGGASSGASEWAALQQAAGAEARVRELDRRIAESQAAQDRQLTAALLRSRSKASGEAIHEAEIEESEEVPEMSLPEEESKAVAVGREVGRLPKAFHGVSGDDRMILNAANASLLNSVGAYYEKSNSSMMLSQIPEYHIDDNTLRQYFRRMMPQGTHGRYNPKIAAFGMYATFVGNPTRFREQMADLGVRNASSWN